VLVHTVQKPDHRVDVPPQRVLSDEHFRVHTNLNDRDSIQHTRNSRIKVVVKTAKRTAVTSKVTKATKREQIRPNLEMTLPEPSLPVLHICASSSFSSQPASSFSC
jgi:hypothetical protein